MKDFLNKIGASLATVIRVILLSRKPLGKKHGTADGELLILGNGPALRNAIDVHMPRLESATTLAVNFAANAPEFHLLKPDYYMLADPHFFTGESKDENVGKLFQSLSAVNWPMTLFVPHRYLPQMRRRLSGGNIAVEAVNLTPAEGFKPLIHPLFRTGLAMPRPRNVLIPSIMIGIRLGYKRIILCGADHTWTRTLSVDGHNHVISVQPHFYKDSGKEQKRVDTEYAGLHLHNILQSLYITFKAYHEIKAFADKQGVEILNATPGSMIDAFPRISL